MNLGYEDDELKPYTEPELDFKELKRIGMLFMGGRQLFHELSLSRMLKKIFLYAFIVYLNCRSFSWNGL